MTSDLLLGVLAGWLLGVGSLVAAWQIRISLRYRRLAKDRAEAYLRFRRELAPQTMPDPGERTYPALPLVDGSSPESSAVVVRDDMATKVSRRIA